MSAEQIVQRQTEEIYSTGVPLLLASVRFLAEKLHRRMTLTGLAMAVSLVSASVLSRTEELREMCAPPGSATGILPVVVGVWLLLQLKVLVRSYSHVL